jgi:hypothetical protein
MWARGFSTNPASSSWGEDKWIEWDRGINDVKPKVQEPGDGYFDSGDLFNLAQVVEEPTQYCGFGGILQSAYRMNKTHFWDSLFQRELATVGVYLNVAARRINYVDDDGLPYYPDSFVGFNDDSRTDLSAVLKLFKSVLKELKALESAKAERLSPSEKE